MVDRDAAGHQARAGVSDEDGSLDADGVEQGRDVGGEVRHLIAGSGLVGVPVATLGDRDGADRPR